MLTRTGNGSVQKVTKEVLICSETARYNNKIHEAARISGGGMKISAMLHASLMPFFFSTSSYQILAKTPLIGQYEKSWKGNLNLPSAGRLLQNPSQLGEATQLVKKLNELADYGIHLDSQKKIALTHFLLTIGPALGWVSRSYGHCPKKQWFSFKIASLREAPPKLSPGSKGHCP